MSRSSVVTLRSTWSTLRVPGEHDVVGDLEASFVRPLRHCCRGCWACSGWRCWGKRVHGAGVHLVGMTYVDLPGVRRPGGLPFLLHRT